MEVETGQGASGYHVALCGHVPREVVMFGSLGFGEIVLILLIVILIFGTSRIPELGRGLGEGIKNFKKAIKGEEDEKSTEKR
jgi:sec-independent protein translocase protein TatA